ncbi:MAG: hypothetical protein U0271_42050 [Polyangiaceae bacterium]
MAERRNTSSLIVPGVLGPDFGQGDVEALEAEVAPRYLAIFDDLVTDRVLVAPDARVLTCGPLASSLVAKVSERLADAHFTVYEPSRAGVEAAQSRTSTTPFQAEYAMIRVLPFSVRDASQTHSLVVHPLSGAADRLHIMKESMRALVPGGQLVYALPLRGSYPEILDMLREFALKCDQPRVAEAVELAAQSRPTPETLVDDLERLGFVDVAVDVELLSVAYDNGPKFVPSPLFRLMIAPELTALLALPAATVQPALEYARTALAKYWSDGQFDLTVNIGCAIARKPAQG